MSNSGKVFLALAIVFSLVTAVLGFMVAQQRSQFASQLADVESTLKSSPDAISYTANFKANANEPAATLERLNSAFQKAVTELSETTGQLTETRERLTKVEAESQRLTTDITSAKRDLETKTTEFNKAEASLKQVQSELQTMKDQLGGRQLQVVLDDLKVNQERLQILAAEKKIIEDSMARLQLDLNRLQELDRLRAERVAPMELNGKVLAINKSWNFVVLDVGKDSRLVVGVDLTVYRGDNLIGKVRTVSVDASTAIADILPDWTKSEIQVGDSVLF